MEVKPVSKFKKDYKRCQRQGRDMSALQSIVALLASPSALPRQNNDHVLFGNWIGYRECHIQPDWILVYRYVDGYLELSRTGTHADIFGL